MLKTGFSKLASASSQASRGISSNSPSNENISTEFFLARVVDISINSNSELFDDTGEWGGIGSIKFQKLDKVINPSVKSEENTTFATPLSSQIKSYPLVNELVLILKGPATSNAQTSGTTTYYYVNSVSLWNNQHANPYPDNVFTNTEVAPPMNKSIFDILAGSTKKQSETVTQVNLNGNSKGTFSEKANIHPILPFAGDNIFEGRFGNSIRLGNTSKTGGKQNNWSETGENGSPISILRNGQPISGSSEGYIPEVEDINKDLTSIYLTSTQKIPIEVATSITAAGQASTVPFSTITSPPVKSPKSYNQPQIILNSGRLLFNSISDSIIFSSHKSIVAEARLDAALKSQTRNVNIIAEKGIVRVGTERADQSAVKGDDFNIQFDALLVQLKLLCKALENEPALSIAKAQATLTSGNIDTIRQALPNYLSKKVKIT